MNKNRRAGWGVLGGLLALMGLTWTLQGLGVLPGSAMTGVAVWAAIGPIVAIIGVFLVAWAVRSRRP
jgi:amino acid transporter